MNKLILCCLTAALATLAATHAHAQADLTFSGGNGAPLDLTIDAPITYVVTTASTQAAPSFLFQGVGDYFDFQYESLSGTVTFTINGGAAQALDEINSGISDTNVAPTDDYIFNFNSFPGVSVGDVVVLNAGTLTTSRNFTGAPPASGSFPTFIFQSGGTKLDAVDGVSAVPEPSTWALLGLGAVSMGVVGLRRWRAHA